MTDQTCMEFDFVLYIMSKDFNLYKHFLNNMVSTLPGKPEILSFTFPGLKKCLEFVQKLGKTWNLNWNLMEKFEIYKFGVSVFTLKISFTPKKNNLKLCYIYKYWFKVKLTWTQTQKLFIQPHIIQIKVFTYITFQYNGPRRPPLRQNYVAGMGATQMRYLYVHVYIIVCIYMYIYIIIHNNIRLARNKYIT